MYAPVCKIQRLAELQEPGTGRREAGGGLRVAGGRWPVVGDWRRMVAEIMTSVDNSLNLIFSMATATRSHDASRSLC